METKTRAFAGRVHILEGVLFSAYPSTPKRRHIVYRHHHRRFERCLGYYSCSLRNTKQLMRIIENRISLQPFHTHFYSGQSAWCSEAMPLGLTNAILVIGFALLIHAEVICKCIDLDLPVPDRFLLPKKKTKNQKSTHSSLLIPSRTTSKSFTLTDATDRRCPDRCPDRLAGDVHPELPVHCPRYGPGLAPGLGSTTQNRGPVASHWFPFQGPGGSQSLQDQSLPGQQAIHLQRPQLGCSVPGALAWHSGPPRARSVADHRAYSGSRAAC